MQMKRKNLKMLRNSIQHILYYKQQSKNELNRLLKFLILTVYILIPFNIAEVLRKTYLPKHEIFLSFFFWAICILLIVYWIPNKKEYKEWKKNHSTF